MKNDERYEIRFSGSGGQGIITAAVVMADGVGAFDNKHVCQTQSYGPEARGGKSKAEVVISGSPIDYPKALRVDLLLAMTQVACDAYFSDIKADGLLVVDSGLVKHCQPVARLPFLLLKLQRKRLAGNWLQIWWPLELLAISAARSLLRD